MEGGRGGGVAHAAKEDGPAVGVAERTSVIMMVQCDVDPTCDAWQPAHERRGWRGGGWR